MAVPARQARSHVASREQYEAKYPGRAWPPYDPGNMVLNLFVKRPGWRAAEGYGQPALGYPQ